MADTTTFRAVVDNEADATPPVSTSTIDNNHVRDDKTDNKKCSLCRTFSPILYVFQVVTQMYVSVHYLVPFVFGAYEAWVQYYMKVFVSYVLVMGMTNWLCAVCVSSEYKPSTDRSDPDMTDLGRPSPEHHANVRPRLQDDKIATDVSENEELSWRYCTTCDTRIPPRTHHCKFCRKCIMRLDHHCHLVGRCIGHWNQKYFVVLCVHTSVACYVGAFMTFTYLVYHHSSDTSLWIYFAPCMFFKVITGSIDSLKALLIFHAYMQCVFGPLSTIYAYGQFKFIARGKTIYEIAKEKKILVTSSRSKNFQLVFGDYWLLNFLFPAQIIFKQKNDGLHYDGVKTE